MRNRTRSIARAFGSLVRGSREFAAAAKRADVSAVTGSPATVELLAYSPDSKIAAKTSVPLGAGQYLQLGGVFKSLGFSNVYNGRITARVTGGTGRVAAYGSVIDNRTTDPTYVPSQ